MTGITFENTGIKIGTKFHFFVKEGLNYSTINKEAANLVIDHISAFGLVGKCMHKTFEYVFRRNNPSAPNVLLEQKGVRTNTVMTVECKEWAGLDRFDPYIPIYLTTVHRKKREDLGNEKIKAHPVHRAYTFGTYQNGISNDDWIKIIQRMSRD